MNASHVAANVVRELTPKPLGKSTIEISSNTSTIAAIAGAPGIDPQKEARSMADNREPNMVEGTLLVPGQGHQLETR